ALHAGFVATSSMPEMVPVVTPVVALNEVAFSFQGRPLTATVTPIPPTVQPVKEALLIVPIPAPARPLPFFSVPDSLIEVHLATVPVAVSFTWPFPEKLKAPPGLTVQVAFTARAAPVPMPITRAVAAALVSTILRVSRVRIVIDPLSLTGLPDPARRSGCFTFGHIGPPIGYRRVRYRDVTLRARGRHAQIRTILDLLSRRISLLSSIPIC